MSDAGRRRDRLPLTASLFLELLAALILSLALADPRMEETEAVVHLVAVLDDSASMQAARPGKPSFRDACATELQNRAELAGRDARLTLIRSGLHPTMIGTRAILLDEPFQGLAPALALRYAEALKRLRDALPDVAILITESNPGLLRPLVDSTYVIERGEIAPA